MDHPLDLTIVLLGKTGSEKSATGNTILGRDLFEVIKSMDSVTKSCQIKVSDVGGRSLSVIDTPGMFDTSMTEKEVKAEIEKCVYLSVPCPHVFLLVIRLDVRFTEEEINTVKWIQKNFGEDAVKYTIILFTNADDLGGKTLDEYIRKCKNIQLLFSQCVARYHSFNNNNTDNQDQVTELLNKIDELVKENEGKHYTNVMYKKDQNKIEWDNFLETALTAAAGGATTVVLSGALGEKAEAAATAHP